MSRGRLAIVLHTHMPYVEWYGRVAGMKTFDYIIRVSQMGGRRESDA